MFSEIGKSLKNVYIKNYRKAFLIFIFLTYFALFMFSGKLQGKAWIDEENFFETSLQFSHNLFPSLEQLTNYSELNTPLPFIIYGQIQNLFQGDLFAGRLLNFALSIIISLIVGWPKKNNKVRPTLALVGLFLFPYFLWFSIRYYTDIIATFFVLLGAVAYLQKFHIASGIAFILGIASRQYTLAFPVAIAAYELVYAVRERRKPSLSFFIPAIAGMTIFGWFILFGGLAPDAAFESRTVPDVQKSLWNLDINSGLYFLSCLGFFYVIPEFLLFRYSMSWRKFLSIKKLSIASFAFILFIAFPPYLMTHGLLGNIKEYLSLEILILPLFYGLLLITCWRFSKVSLTMWLIVFNTLIMMKAFPWDKYALPLIVVLWYLQARTRLQIPAQRE